MTTRHHRSDIYSHVGQPTPVVVVCPWCNTWFHTLDLKLAEQWLVVTHPPNCRKDVMATAGPAKDMKGVDTGADQDRKAWVFRCNECQEVIATGDSAAALADGAVIREAQRNHQCTGKRVGRITED